MAGQQMSSAFDSSSKKYDVFLSFRGEDTRRNFTSHLYDALNRKKVETFIDNNELQKGDEISPALIKAIEESHVSIVVFSENYASSKWCLNELKKILECKQYMEQIVIPVFYNIDPSHVRKQTGSYKHAFAKHKRDLKSNNDKLQEWKAALTEAASLVGWDLQNYRNESDFIKNIVEDVLQKLNLKYCEFKGLVGVEKNYEQIESMLKFGSNEVKVLGIWGMGGIGKTTLARTLYAKLYSQFEGRCFLNVMDESNKDGLNVLHNKFLSSLLEEENLHPDASYIESSFSVRRIARKKVFIVLDGVETIEKIGDLIQKIDGLGPGSRVVITTRDKHIFSQFSNCEIYEVSELNNHDSIQLFSLTAFGEKKPKIGYEDLSESVIAYCKGNPLALKVLGANLRSRGKEAWENELKKLEKIPNGEIYNVLKFSYDYLDSFQKAIFLDIACYFRGKSRFWVTLMLEACEFFAKIGIEVLLDKALIQLKPVWHFHANVEADGLEMHDLLQEMGREIVNHESIDPGKRSRLWKNEDIFDVLKNNKGTEVVECIKFDCSEVGDLYLKSDTFKRMTNLRYLVIYDKFDGIICNLHFPDGLEQLSDKLRIFSWDGYCLEYLPSTFSAEMLVFLCMRHSKLKKLWDGVQNLVNLQYLRLDYSKDLIEIPDLSRATNLGNVYLYQCESLRQLHPSIFALPQLEYLDLRRCEKIESLKTDIHSKSLRVLLLNGCSSLTEFSVTSEKMTELSLRGTSIHEFSSSFWHNTERTVLELDDCRKLVSLTEIPPSLVYLKAVNCTSLDTDSTQWSLLMNRAQKLFEDEGVIAGFSFLPGAQVPLYFDFQTIGASINILPIPKSDLCGFIFCILFSEGFTVNHHALHCIIFECGKVVDRRCISLNYLGTLITDHVLICWHGWHGYNRQESRSNDVCNLSFQFILQESGSNGELRWSKEEIKGCGVEPVYRSGSISKEIGKLKSTAQDSDVSIAIGGEGRGSNNENEDDKEQPSVSRPPIKHVYVRRRSKVVRPHLVGRD